MYKFNCLWRQSLTRIRIRIDPHWFGSLDPDPHGNWIRICTETNADPQHGPWPRIFLFPREEEEAFRGSYGKTLKNSDKKKKREKGRQQ